LQKGFIGSLVIIIFLALAGFFIYSKSLAVSSDKTQKAAQSIPKYPNANLWEISNKSFCLFNISTCKNSSTKIKFRSDQPWNTIYYFYRESMKHTGWSTNSLIVTSIPSSIVFANTADCQADLQEVSNFQFFQKDQTKTYLFAVFCK